MRTQEYNFLRGIFITILFSSVFLFYSTDITLSDGKDIFLDKKCHKCHSVKSLGIEPLPSSLKRKKKITDLSGAGLEKDADWIKKWLKKKVRNEKGKKHKKKWKGTEAELEEIVKWLANLKVKIDEKEIKAWYEELRRKIK